MKFVALRYSCNLAPAVLATSVAALLGSATAAEPNYDAWVKGLNAQEYKERKETSSAIVKWADENIKDDQAIRPMLDMLFDRHMNTESPEVRLRLYVALKNVVVKYKKRMGRGFVGIAMETGELHREGERFTVVVVSRVTPNTPAEKAGLKPNDLIYGVNDLVFKDKPNEDSSMQFAAYIRNKIPGDKVNLMIFRSGKKIEVPLTLMRFPAELEKEQALMEQQRRQMLLPNQFGGVMRPGMQWQLQGGGPGGAGASAISTPEELYFKKWYNDKKKAYLEKNS